MIKKYTSTSNNTSQHEYEQIDSIIKEADYTVKYKWTLSEKSVCDFVSLSSVSVSEAGGERGAAAAAC